MNSIEKTPQSLDEAFEVNGYKVEIIDRDEVKVISCEIQIPRSEISEKFGIGSKEGLDGNGKFFEKFDSVFTKTGCRASGAVYGTVHDIGGDSQAYGQNGKFSFHFDKQKVGDKDVKKMVTDMINEVMS